MWRPLPPLLLLSLLTACVEVTIPADTAGGAPSGSVLPDPIITPWSPGTTAGIGDTSGSDGGLEWLDAGGLGPDVEVPTSCNTHCDCPAGWDCINGRCRLGELAILCCGAGGCPVGETCWTAEGVRGVCGQ